MLAGLNSTLTEIRKWHVYWVSLGGASLVRPLPRDMLKRPALCLTANTAALESGVRLSHYSQSTESTRGPVRRNARASVDATA